MRIPRPGRRAILAAAVVAAVFVLARLLPFQAWLSGFVSWIGSLGPEGMVLYAAAYALVTVTLMPAWLMTIGAGFLFGLLPGVAVVSAGSTLGAAGSFLIARYLARERVAAWAARYPKFRAVDRAIGAKGWKIVFLLRLSPLVPFVFSNYFYGITAIRFVPYVAATWVGMFPVIFLYAALGVAGREASGVEETAPPGPWKMATLAAIILVTLVATLYVARVARRAVGADAVRGRP